MFRALRLKKSSREHRNCKVAPLREHLRRLRARLRVVAFDQLQLDCFNLFDDAVLPHIAAGVVQSGKIEC
jgi:hypothetical protein